MSVTSLGLDSCNARRKRTWYASTSMSRTWQTCSIGLKGSLGIPFQDDGLQFLKSGGTSA